MSLRQRSAPLPLAALLATTGLVGALLLTTSALTTSGCEPVDTCSETSGTTRCAGVDLQQCEVSVGPGYWGDLGICGAKCTPETCPAGPVSLCITNPRGKAFCAVSPTRVPECASGAPTVCWRNALVTCDMSGYVASVYTPCGDLTCADSTFGTGPLCAASPTPVPECSTGVTTACWQDQIVTCDPTGYVRSVVEACRDLDCVDTPGCGPLCVLPGGPNPLCTPTTKSVCVNGTPTHCQCGYGVGIDPPCGAPDLCQTAPLPGQDPDAGDAQTGAFCVVSPTPTPGCPSTGTYTICVGSTLVQCNAGWATSETPCPGECHAYGGVGSCG